MLLPCLLIVACSQVNYNPTVYDNQYNEGAAAKKNIKHIMIAPINFDKPSRYYLQKEAGHIDVNIKQYLEANGYRVVSSRAFSQQWKKKERQYGTLYDPTTGKHTRVFKQALAEVMENVFSKSPKLDAILFSDLVTSKVHYSDMSTHTAQWDGVTRRLKVQGLGTGLIDDVDWQKLVDGISLVTYIFTRDNELLQHGVGGIQIAQALQLNNNSGTFKRRRDLLSNNKEVDEAVQLALHPFVVMPNYPQKPQKSEL